MKWKWIEPGPNDEPIERFITLSTLITEFYPKWCEGMRKIGKADEISLQNCIDDFVVVHWAERVK